MMMMTIDDMTMMILADSLTRSFHLRLGKVQHCASKTSANSMCLCVPPLNWQGLAWLRLWLWLWLTID